MLRITTAICSCGVLLPSRQHLAWTCPSADEKRRGLRIDEPRCNAEQRLLVKCAPVPFKAKPSGSALMMTFHSIANAMRKIAGSDNACVLVATDGGSDGKCHEDRFASYGLALHDPSSQEPLAFGGPVEGIDGTPLCGEHYAANVALASARLANADITIIIDNMTCMQGVASIMKGNRGPQALPGRWEVTRKLTAAANHTAHWVPSHDKKEEWLPPDGKQETAALVS